MFKKGSPYKVEVSPSLENLPTNQSLFASKPWLEALQVGFGKDIQIARLSDSRGLLIYLPFIQVNRMGMTKAVLPPYTPYGGPFFSDLAQAMSQNTKEEMTIELLSFMNARYHYNHHFPTTELENLPKAWQKNPRKTLLLDLSTTEDLLDKKTRYRIRKARKEGFQLFKNSTESALFIQFLEQTFTRQGLKPMWSTEATTKWHQAAIRGGLLIQHRVELEGVTHLYAHYALCEKNKTMYAICSARNPHFPQSLANYFQKAELLLAPPSSIDTLDHCGADHNHIASFKKKFSTNTKSLNSVESYQNLFAKVYMEEGSKLLSFFRNQIHKAPNSSL